MRKLDSHRRCNCDPDARGHLEAVLGAEAVLRRLGRYQEGDSLVRRLKELHQDASQPHVREALGDVGRGVASVMAGSIATTDPVQVALAGALAHQHIVDAMNEQLDDYDVSTRVALYRGTNGDLVGLRGAALAVLRGGLYRGFFSYARHSPSPGVADDLPEGWRGWDEASPGAQSGRTGRGDSAWVYRPLLIDEAAVDRLSEKALESDPKVSKAVA
jgi:hypothetical protein